MMISYKGFVCGSDWVNGVVVFSGRISLFFFCYLLFLAVNSWKSVLCYLKFSCRFVCKFLIKQT